ncbi:MAG: hypothetical protein RMK57_00120 [Bryobacterales bacterium]|nr:hypothetical protein [Bryobacteraceae bacterium]MDW8352911.1 hypothetical protein [Bryobacterales bacterium]
MLTAALLLTAGVILYALAVRPQDLPEAEPPSPTQHLEERKAAIYENLRDLQFEYRTGKLSDADYQQTKLDLQRELAAVLAEIERLQPTAAKPKAASASAPARPAAQSVCPKCGARFDRPMKFCGECGTAMNGASA